LPSRIFLSQKTVSRLLTEDLGVRNVLSVLVPNSSMRPTRGKILFYPERRRTAKTEPPPTELNLCDPYCSG
ncbi:Hypothetical protein FKW44_006857, partial [Caligus rogercresseyi]